MRWTLVSLVLAALTAPSPRADACTCAPGQLLSPREGETTSTNPVFLYLTAVPGVDVQLHDAAGQVVPISIERREHPDGGRDLIVVRPMVPLARKAAYSLDVTVPPGTAATTTFQTGDGPDEQPPASVEGLASKAFGIVLPDTVLGFCSNAPESYDYDILSVGHQPFADDVRLGVVALRRANELAPFDFLYLDPQYQGGDDRFISGAFCNQQPPRLADGETVCLSVSLWDGAGNLSAPRETCVTKERTCAPDPDHGVVCPWAVAPPIAEQDSGCSVTNVAGTHSPASWLGIALALLVLRRRRPQ